MFEIKKYLLKKEIINKNDHNSYLVNVFSKTKHKVIASEIINAPSIAFYDEINDQLNLFFKEKVFKENNFQDLDFHKFSIYDYSLENTHTTNNLKEIFHLQKNDITLKNKDICLLDYLDNEMCISFQKIFNNKSFNEKKMKITKIENEKKELFKNDICEYYNLKKNEYDFLITVQISQLDSDYIYSDFLLNVINNHIISYLDSK